MDDKDEDDEETTNNWKKPKSHPVAHLYLQQNGVPKWPTRMLAQVSKPQSILDFLPQ